MQGFIAPLVLLVVGALLFLYPLRPGSPWSRQSFEKWRLRPPKWLAVIGCTVVFGWLAYFFYNIVYLDLIVPRQTHAYLREHRCFVSGRNAASGISYRCQDGTTVWHKW